MLSLLHPCDRIAYINNNLQFDKWWNAVVSNRRHYVKVHIADIKGQKSLDVSTNVKPRMGVFPLRAKIWDALDEGCSCWEMEDKREWKKQWKSKKGAIQREKDRIRTKRWKKDAQGAWKISRWFPLFFYQPCLLFPHYWRQSRAGLFSTFEHHERPPRTRKILDSVSLKRKKK